MRKNFLDLGAGSLAGGARDLSVRKGRESDVEDGTVCIIVLRTCTRTMSTTSYPRRAAAGEEAQA